MSIVRMKRLRLLAVRSLRDDLLREMMLLGCVEVTEPSVRLDDPEWEALVQREKGGLEKQKADQAKLMHGLKLLDKYAPAKSKMFSPKPEISQDELLDESKLTACLSAVGQMEQHDERVRRAVAEISGFAGQIASLEPWASLDVPLDMTGTKLCQAMTLTVPASVDLDELDSSLSQSAPEAQLLRVSEDKEQSCLMLVCMRDEQASALEALRGFGYSQAAVQGTAGTARENIGTLEKRIEQLKLEKEETTKAIAEFAPLREEIKLCFDRVGTLIAQAEARERLLTTGSAVFLEGWMTAPDEEKLTDLFTRYGCAWEITDPVPDDYSEVPVKLKNNKFTRCLSMVTEMYSLPAYGSVDPNPLMAPFFVLFYGIMMADMGYGLLMVIAGLVILKKAKPQKGMRNFFELMLYCGISTMVWGAITGGFFGDFIPQLLRTINPESTFEWFWKPLFTPLDDTISILLGSLVLGFIHIITGTVIGFYRKVKGGNLVDGIFEEGSWWVIFAGGGMAVLGVGNIGGVPVVLVIGAVMLVYGAGRHSKGAGKITSAFGAIYNGVTGYFGDILSYSRLMALMLAGSVIAQVFNTIGAIPGNIVILIVISLIGNALNFGLNLLGCFVHDLRLQCLEYFGKFYEDGGKAFKPLAIDTKYYEIIK